MATIVTTSAARFPALEDLRALARESGVCLSVYLPLASGWMLERDALAHARHKLAEGGLSAEEIDAFLTPVTEVIETAIKDHMPGEQTLGVFRSTERLLQFRLPYLVDERIQLSGAFDMLPVLKCVSLASEFYILALSQKHARLIRCTRNTSEEVELPETVPTSLHRFMQTDKPDHRLENRSSGGQQGGGTHPGLNVAFGTGTESERKDEYLYHYYNELDKQLQTFLRDRPLPMVIAGVDYERSIYHSCSEYPALVPDGVHGAADGLKGGELHARALVAVDEYMTTVPDHALAQFEKAGAERILMEVQDILRSAADGRVLHLFLAEGARHPGGFDALTREVREESGAPEDLLNLAARETLTHAGDVFVLPPEKVPGGGQIAAVLRY